MFIDGCYRRGATSLDAQIEALEALSSTLGKNFDDVEVDGRIRELTGIIEEERDTRNREEYRAEQGRLIKLREDYTELSEEVKFVLGFARLYKLQERKEAVADSFQGLCDARKSVRGFLFRYKFTDKHDMDNTYITIKAEDGRNDMADHVHNLAKTYASFAVDQGFSVEVVHRLDNEVMLKVDGEYAHALFSGEQGSHKFEYVESRSKRKKRTGFIRVDVDPELKERDLRFDPGRIKYTFLGGSTKGGQGANNNRNCVRATYKIETEPEPVTMTAVARGRSTYKNKKATAAVLQARVLEFFDRVEGSDSGTYRPPHSRHIRTYNLNGGNFVRDERVGLKTNGANNFFSGKSVATHLFAYHGLCPL